MYQRTMKFTLSTGLMPDLLLRMDLEIAPLVHAASGFIAYYAVAVDESTVVTTRIFRDREAMDAETQAASGVSQSVADEFGLTGLETIVDGNIGVTRCYAPFEEFTP